MKPKPDEFALPPADLDLREFDWMPLNVKLLRDSDLMLRADPESLRAALMLWCASWHQIPAGSLPDDDRVLMGLAGLGRDTATWAKLKNDALHKFVLRSETGRWHHPVITAYALEAAKRKLDAKKAAETRWKGHVPTPRKPRKSKGENAAALPAHMRADMRNACARNAIEMEKEKERSQGFVPVDPDSEIPEPSEKEPPPTPNPEPREPALAEVVRVAAEVLGPNGVGMARNFATITSPGEALEAIRTAGSKKEPIKYFQSMLNSQRRIEHGVPQTPKPKPKWDRAL